MGLDSLSAVLSTTGVALSLIGPGIIVGAPLGAVGAFCSAGSALYKTPLENERKGKKDYYSLRRVNIFLQRKSLISDVMMISQVVVVCHVLDEFADSVNKKKIKFSNHY